MFKLLVAVVVACGRYCFCSFKYNSKEYKKSLKFEI